MASLNFIVPRNKLGTIAIASTISESHSDALRLTDHPVETGTPITDHSYLEPQEVTLRCSWSNSSTEALSGAIQSLFNGGAPAVADYVSSIYSQLLALQQSRQPFSVIAGRRSYQTMLMSSLRVDRDKNTAEVLAVEVTCRQIVIVSTKATQLPPADNQAAPQTTGEIENDGAKQLKPVTPVAGGAVMPE